MAFVVRMTQITDRVMFEDMVNQHIDHLHAFAKTVGKPRPTAHPLVEAAITRVQIKGAPDKYVADYEILDDRPPELPAITLENRKLSLQHQLMQAEIVAKHKVLPKRRERLLLLTYNLAQAKLEVQRTTEDNEAIADFLEIQKKFRAIELFSAKIECDIEDLTESTIDNWKVPDFDNA